MQVTLPATQGRFQDPMAGGRVITFGDPCPGCETGIAVHEPVIAAIAADGDVILPQFYALCCDCHKEQQVQKYGVENWTPCVDDQIAIDLKLMNKPPQPIGIGSSQVSSY